MTSRSEEHQNATIKFSDGVTFDTRGPLRVTRRRDGWYVIGEGMLIPCSDEHEAAEILNETRRGD